jgi:hypothetical protein
VLTIQFSRTERDRLAGGLRCLGGGYGSFRSGVRQEDFSSSFCGALSSPAFRGFRLGSRSSAAPLSWSESCAGFRALAHPIESVERLFRVGRLRRASAAEARAVGSPAFRRRPVASREVILLSGLSLSTTHSRFFVVSAGRSLALDGRLLWNPQLCPQSPRHISAWL